MISSVFFGGTIGPGKGQQLLQRHRPGRPRQGVPEQQRTAFFWSTPRDPGSSSSSPTVIWLCLRSMEHSLLFKVLYPMHRENKV